MHVAKQNLQRVVRGFRHADVAAGDHVADVAPGGGVEVQRRHHVGDVGLLGAVPGHILGRVAGLLPGHEVGERSGHLIARAAVSVLPGVVDHGAKVKVPVDLAPCAVVDVDAEHGRGGVGAQRARAADVLEHGLLVRVDHPCQQAVLVDAPLDHVEEFRELNRTEVGLNNLDAGHGSLGEVVVHAVAVEVVPVGVRDERLGCIVAVDDAAVGQGGAAAHEAKQPLEHDGIHGDNPVDRLSLAVLPRLRDQACRAREVGREGHVGGRGAQRLAEQDPLLVGDGQGGLGDGRDCAERRDLAERDLSVVHGHYGHGARQSAGRADLRVVLGNDQIAARAVAANHGRQHAQGVSVLAQEARRDAQGLAHLVHQVVKHADLELAHAVHRLGGRLDGGGHLQQGVAQRLHGRAVEAPVGDEAVEGIRHQRVAHGHQRVVDEVACDGDQLACGGDVVADHGKVRGDVPDDPARLLLDVVQRALERLGVGLQRRSVAGLDGVHELLGGGHRVARDVADVDDRGAEQRRVHTHEHDEGKQHAQDGEQPLLAATPTAAPASACRRVVVA